MRAELTLKRNSYHYLIGTSNDLKCKYKQKCMVTIEELLTHQNAIAKIKRETIIALKAISLCENEITALEIKIKEKKKSNQARDKN